jgi:hypothetical protein
LFNSAECGFEDVEEKMRKKCGDNRGRQLYNVKTGTSRSLSGNSISVDQSFPPHHHASVHSVNV